MDEAAFAGVEQADVCTIGHSTRGFDEVMGMLHANGITHLVDVRSFPSSRANPQWAQPAIIEALPGDIAYRWIRELGGRRHTPAGVASHNGAWRVKAFRDYADYMATDSFRQGLEELIGVAGQGVPVIMCSEAVPWRCHRRLITDALIVAGLSVAHILSATRVERARLNPLARVHGGLITYPGAADADTVDPDEDSRESEEGP